MTETKTETAAEPEIPEAAPRRPGDLTQRQLLERIVRVDHAGEYGARRIYEGQLAVLKRSPSRPVIQQMWEQEARTSPTSSPRCRTAGCARHCCSRCGTSPASR